MIMELSVSDENLIAHQMVFHIQITVVSQSRCVTWAGRGKMSGFGDDDDDREETGEEESRYSRLNYKLNAHLRIVM